MGNRNSSSSKVHGRASKVASTEPSYDLTMGKPVSEFRDEYSGKSKAESSIILKGRRGIGVYSEQQSKVPLDNDDTFNDFIRRAKKNIRTVSHIGREQSHVAAAAPPPDEANYVSNSKENQNDQFSSFIQRAKKKLRTTSSIRKNGSFKSG